MVIVAVLEGTESYLPSNMATITMEKDAGKTSKFDWHNE